MLLLEVSPVSVVRFSASRFVVPVVLVSVVLVPVEMRFPKVWSDFLNNEANREYSSVFFSVSWVCAV